MQSLRISVEFNWFGKEFKKCLNYKYTRHLLPNTSQHQRPLT